MYLDRGKNLTRSSRDEAISKLKQFGVASACHMLIADASGGTGLESSSIDIITLPMSSGQVFHTNHYLLPHPGIVDTLYLTDSLNRIKRIRALAEGLTSTADKDELTEKEIFNLFKDEEDYPNSINRCQLDGCETATLFNIVMDLKERTAQVSLGRPSEVEGVFRLSFT